MLSDILENSKLISEDCKAKVRKLRFSLMNTFSFDSEINRCYTVMCLMSNSQIFNHFE